MKHKALKAAVFSLFIVGVLFIAVVVGSFLVIKWAELTSTNPELAGLLAGGTIAVMLFSVFFKFAWMELSSQEKEKKQ
jgi:hypothetical protein